MIQIVLHSELLHNMSKYLNSIENRLMNPFEVSAKDLTDDVKLYRQRKFTMEELASYNGSGGKPAYVSVNGIVYDVSLSPGWGGGTHFGLYSGKDLSNEFNSCHKHQNILTSLPKVGTL